MSKLSTGSWILLGGGVLLLLDSFIFSWQKMCIDFGGLGDLVGGGGVCAKASMWGGDAGFVGVIVGLLVIALIVWEVIGLVGMDLSLPMAASKISAYLGFATLAFVIIKFLLVMTNEVAFGAFLGLVFALAIGYGAWMRFQEPETKAAAPPPPAP
jgi:hypothetical protein